MMLQNVGNQLATNINNNLDILCTAGALFGLGTTVFLAVRATPEAERLIFDAGEAIDGIIDEGKEKGWPKEVIDASILETRLYLTKDLAKLYALAIVSGITTGALIIGSTTEGRKQNMALTSLLNASNLMYNEYREHTRQAIGERKEKEIYDDIRSGHMERTPISSEDSIYNTGNGHTLCHIELNPGLPATGLYFWSSPESVYAAENKLNQLQLDWGSVSMADWLYCLDIKIRPENAGNLGWREPIIFADTSHMHSVLHYPVLGISFKNNPKPLSYRS